MTQKADVDHLEVAGNRLLDGLTFDILIPAAVLALLFLLLLGILIKAQTRHDFDIANFLRDDRGKESSGRAFGFVCLAIHCWWVATLVFQKLSTIDHFIWFGVIWAGTPVVIIIAQRWGGNLPLAQPGYPPTRPSDATEPPKP